MRRLLSLSLVLLLCLALLGVGYARWFDVLTIDGTVNTGELGLAFDTDYTVKDIGPDWTCDTQFYNVRPIPEGKDVGSNNVTLIDDHTFQITWDNVYPCYYDNFTFHYRPTGSIPVIINEVRINPGQPGEVVLNEFDPTYFLIDLSGDNVPDLECNWGDNIGAQKHPGDRIETSFDMHVLQECPEGELLSLLIEIEAMQYNEYVAPGP